MGEITSPDDGTLRVGVDLVVVSEVRASIDRFGRRYLERLFTAQELADCSGESQAAGLAGRFAAKEAARKVLRSSGGQPSWRSLEVRRAAWGGCSLHLAPEALASAEAEGIGAWSLSMTHEGDLAAAVVVARCQGAGGPLAAPPGCATIGSES